MKRIEKLGLLAVLIACFLIAGVGPAFSEQAEPNAYPKVNIRNSTQYSVSGKVSYRSGVCSDDNYGMGPWKEWTASSRGVCLVTKITADVSTWQGTKTAKPYTSSGTSYSQFAVIQTSDDPLEFEVIRRANSSLVLDSNGDEALGDGWEYSDWFGFYYAVDEPWVYHPDHQWLYAWTDSTGAMGFWDPKMGALWRTDEATYPYCYRPEDGAWLYYLMGSKDPRYFYNYNTSMWESH